MKTNVLSILLALVAASSSAFVVPQNTHKVTTFVLRKVEDAKLTLAASTLDSNESKNKNSDISKNKEDTSSTNSSSDLTSFNMREKEMEVRKQQVLHLLCIAFERKPKIMFPFI